MTTEPTAPHPAGGESVLALHARWTEILDLLTRLRLFEATARQARVRPDEDAEPGADAGRKRRRPTRAERAALVAEGRALERRIAGTRARRMAEVVLKLKMAACPILISGDWRPLVESAARDLERPLPEPPPGG